MNANHHHNTVWSDEPFGVEDSDAFGRDSFVATVVDRIQLATPTDASTVFGLVGAWGSGKTSILNRVRAGLAGDWLIADFTPWSSGDAAAMSLEFVSTLADVLGEKTLGETRARLSDYAGFAAPLLGAIPLVGDGLKDTAESALESLARRPPWHRQFEELSKAIQALGKRVLIVVDDVDRLGGSELLTLLRVIRLLGRFKGVHYLVAYDQDTIEDLLRSTGSVGRSTAFMEKIVQYPFETPPLPQASVIRLLDSVLNELLDVTSVQLDEVGLQRASELVNILAPQVHTPRSLGRFREHLLSFADHVDSARLDLLDYVATTWLRLSAHGVWTSLPRWQGELRTGARTINSTETEMLAADDWEKRIRAVDKAADAEGALEVLSFLFEGVDVRGRSWFVKHDRGLSEPTVFGRYLLLAIPEDDFDDRLIEIVVDEADASIRQGAAVALAAVMDSDNDALSNLAVNRMANYRRQSQAPSPGTLRFLAERLKARKEEEERVGAPRNSLRVLLSREVALAILDKVIEPQEIIGLVGEREALALVWQGPRSPEFRGRGAEIADGFATYWEAELPMRAESYGDNGMLGAIGELIVTCREPEQVQGLLDATIADYGQLVRIAIAFVYVSEWVGSRLSYEMHFRSDTFRVLVSDAVRERFRPELSAEAGTRGYETDDHHTRDIPVDILRAYAIDSVMKLLPTDPTPVI